MPVGAYATFGACVAAQRAKGRSEPSARRICGWLEQQVRKARFADEESDVPAWVALHEAGDRLVPKMSGRILTVLETFAEGIGLRTLRAAAAGQYTALTDRLVDLGEHMATPADVIAEAVIEGGHIGAAQVPTGLARGDVRKDLTFAFDVERPEALAWAQQHAGALVRHLQDGAISTIREIVTRGFREGRTVQQIARDLKGMGPVLGLDRGSAAAVDNLRQRLVEDGRLAAFIDRTTATYSERLLRRRAIAIARTEVLTALNEGQREAWRQAKQVGRLRSVTKRTWIVTPDDRLCPRCAPQEDNTASLDGMYTLRSPASGVITGPPLHARCRCAEGLEP